MDNVRTPQQADVVLFSRSTFTLLKTLGQDNFKKSKDRYTDLEVEKELNTIKLYPPRKDLRKPNVVIFILESMGREYWGSLNETLQYS